ncbi:MAG TPA: DUF434 domain-containing protein [Pyrinomonadaceae bacterium]|nr:DUF434 domain-containing protein [Pyrinomonadaceae bacterium]
MSPDRRQHRGAHPEDARLFAPARLGALRTAVAELSWLLGRGYTMKSALKLVGDRHALDERQRLAVSRAACTDEQLAGRASRRVGPSQVAGERLAVDGFNLIITAEAALGGGLVVRGRDGVLRDLSGVHGSYRAVNETVRAIMLAGRALAALGPGAVEWFLDKPISNSGRLAQKIREVSGEEGWGWTVEVVFNPDREIVRAGGVAVTSDSTILDGAARWLNFNEHLLARHVPEAWVVDLSHEGRPTDDSLARLIAD